MPLMTGSSEEVEVKLAFDSPDEARASLIGAGASQSIPRHLEDNAAYDREPGQLAPGDQLLRLRRAREKAWLTFKRPVPGARRHKVRIEHETAVADAEAMHRILEGLGYRVVWRYQKHRTVFSLAGVEACLDETPLGCFVELEGEPDAIDQAARLLGRGPADYIRQSYRDLQRARGGALGAGDLLLS
jgi:adenylate cyclase class 2